MPVRNVISLLLSHYESKRGCVRSSHGAAKLKSVPYFEHFPT